MGADEELTMPLIVTGISCLSDNYLWVLHDTATGAVAVCDPGEAEPAIKAVQGLGGRLDLILLTHHHGDHVGGVAALQAQFGGRIVGASADAHRLPRLDQAVAGGDTVRLGGAVGHVLETPGHTVGHIAFHFPDAPAVLCGDTLFSLGCGRLLEGSAAQMRASLQALAALPPATQVCCGHEYTESNARFALTVEPENAALIARAGNVRALRAAGQPSVPTTIAMELAENPFVRADSVERLAAIRIAKDNFR
jgi:hydroxyacylglutathione hydrolase